MRYDPVFRTIVSMDVIESGSRDDQLIHEMRKDLRNIVAEVMADQSIDIATLHTHDLGDGIQIVAPPEITPRAFLDPFIPRLDAALRAHRKTASSAHRIRLRVAVHFGLVNWDGVNWEGSPFKHVARLLDADVVRRAARAAPEANLVLVVSDDFYRNVVRHGVALDPAVFMEVTMQNKELATPAWIHVPGHSVTSPSTEDGGPGATAAQSDSGAVHSTARPADPPPSAGSGVSIVANQATFHGPVVGGGFHA